MHLITYLIDAAFHPERQEGDRGGEDASNNVFVSISISPVHNPADGLKPAFTFIFFYLPRHQKAFTAGAEKAFIALCNRLFLNHNLIHDLLVVRNTHTKLG